MTEMVGEFMKGQSSVDQFCFEYDNRLRLGIENQQFSSTTYVLKSLVHCTHEGDGHLNPFDLFQSYDNAA